MANECGACGSKIFDGGLMICSNIRCNKRYDLNCLNITEEVFKTFTQTYKKKWVCPECVCLTPKCGNTETPVKINTTEYSVNMPINTITTQRGSQGQFSPTIITDTGMESLLLNELKQFRSDIIARLDSQSNAIQHLQQQFVQTKNDLDHLLKIIAVVEEKVSFKMPQHIQPQDIQELPNEIPEKTPCTYSDTVKQNIKTSKTKINANRQPTTATATQNVNKRGATKTVIQPEQVNVNEQLPTKEDQIVQEEEGGWTDVKKKKPRRLSKDVKVGNNTELKAIVATQRNKYLHVWRLHPDTTVEAITEHVKKVCATDMTLKVEKIKHKIERDYSSFVIGVPEEMYDGLYNAEIWPVHAEFCEWIWFRRSPKNNVNKQ